MPKPTPAMITYTNSEGSKSEVRFHTVISEAHEAQTEITKFPVQTGFSISNHAIRKNRKVVVEGVISNTVLAGAKNGYVYSLNNQKTVFETLEDLVNNATVCEVVTNLGIYNPVVFNKFTTKQAAGMVDSMQFTIMGEEVQVKSTINRTAPKVLTFTKIPETDQKAVADYLARLQFPVTEDMYISKAKATLGTDYSIQSTDNKGKVKTTTYLCKGYDPVSQTYKYETNIEDNGIVHPEPQSQLNLFSIAGKATSAASACLVEGAFDLVSDAAEDFVSTTMGDLRKAAYGFKQDLIKMGGGAVGQALVGLGIDCAIAGAEAGFDAAADAIAPNSAIASAKGLPGTQDIMNQFTKYGQDKVLTPLKDVDIFKIDSFGGLL